MRQRTMPRVASISYSGALNERSTNGRKRTHTKRSRSVYLTRMIPSVQRLRKRQYVRARRSRCIGVQISSIAEAGSEISAAWIDVTAPVAGSIRVRTAGSRMTARPMRLERFSRRRAPVNSAAAAASTAAAIPATTTARNLPGERFSDGVVEPEGRVVEPGRRRRVDDHLRAQAVDQRPREPGAHRRDQAHPV